METFCKAQKVCQSLLLFQIPNPTLPTVQPWRGAGGGDWLIERPKPCKTHSPGDGCKRFRTKLPGLQPTISQEGSWGRGLGDLSHLSHSKAKKKKKCGRSWGKCAGQSSCERIAGWTGSFSRPAKWSCTISERCALIWKVKKKKIKAEKMRAMCRILVVAALLFHSSSPLNVQGGRAQW